MTNRYHYVPEALLKMEEHIPDVFPSRNSKSPGFSLIAAQLSHVSKAELFIQTFQKNLFCMILSIAYS